MLNPQDSYKACAPYYRCIASGRDHFESQLRIVKGLIARFQLRNPRILDAACGSGEVMELLLQNGYDAFGSDGSPDMLSLASEIPSLRNQTRLASPCLWQNLANLSLPQKFDFIFTLGHAFPHQAFSEIPMAIEAVYNRLNPGGIFAFDIRQWIRDADGNLREPSRPLGVRRWKGEFKVDGRHFLLDDCCTYEGHVQRITYRVCHLRQEEKHYDTSFSLEYSIFDTNDVMRWFENSGFRGNAQFFLPEGWPYIVVVAQRSA